MIPLKPSLLVRKARAGASLVLGECSTTRAMAAVFPTAPHLGMRCGDARSFYCGTRVGASPKVEKIFLFNDLNSDIAGYRSQQRLTRHVQDRVGRLRVFVEHVDCLGS